MKKLIKRISKEKNSDNPPEVVKAQYGYKLPIYTNPAHKNYPQPTPVGSVKKDNTPKIYRAADNFYRDNVSRTPFEGIIKTIVPSAAIASGAAAGPILTTAKGVATAAGYGALQGLGFGQLGMGSGNALNDAAYGAAGEVAGPLVGKAIDKGIGAAKQVGTNILKKKVFIKKPDSFTRGIGTSEIDWGKWNKEIPQNKELLNEYNEIEKFAKESGNWMKNPDGTNFKGTPEQFIQQKSSNFKKAFSNTKILDKYNNPQINYHGGKKDIDYFMEPSDPSFVKNKGINSATGDYGIYFSGDKNIAKQYLKGYKKPDRQLYETYINIENPYKTNSFFGLDIKQKFNKEYFNPRRITKHNINKISDSDGVIWHGMKGEIIPIKSNQIKSAIGNNGMFDMTNPNIYKSLIGGAFLNNLIDNLKEEHMK